MYYLRVNTDFLNKTLNYKAKIQDICLINDITKLTLKKVTKWETVSAMFNTNTE